MSTDKSGAGYPGWAGLFAGNSDFNSTDFIVEQMLRLVRTATLVQVVSCTNNDELSAVGFVNVQPLVNLTDGLLQASPHKNLVKLPYSRVQGGLSAIICDPVKGDIGIAIFADRDISAVKSSRQQSPPGSRRHHDLADGLYLFGVLNAQPTQYIRFTQDDNGNPTGLEIIDVNLNKFQMTSTGIKLTDKAGHIINMNATNIAITGDVVITGKLSSTDVTSLGGGAQAVKLADGSNATKVSAT